jgi:hypothetical protein
LRRAAGWSFTHPLLTIALLAVTVRVILAAGVAIFSGGSLFGDDARYIELARQAAAGQTGVWQPYLHQLYHVTGTLLWPLTGLFIVFGGAAIIGQLFVVAFGTATAVLTTKLGLSFMSRGAALCAGAIVALLPSQILWSSIVMKDALVWVLLSGIAVTFVASWNARGWRLIACGAAIVGMLVGLDYLRQHTLEIALVALVLAAIVAPARGRLVRIAAAAVLLLAVPMAFGMGVAGTTFIRDTGSLSRKRALNALDANSAVVTPFPVGKPAPPATSGTPATSATAPAPAAPVGDDLGPSSVSYLPTGLTVIALRPYPWEARSAASSGVRLAGVEALVWYPILLLALIGVTTLRGRLRYMAFPLLAGAATAVMYGLTEGNVGTAYRHRGEFVWVVALLAAMGAERLYRMRSARRRALPAPG